MQKVNGNKLKTIIKVIWVIIQNIFKTILNNYRVIIDFLLILFPILIVDYLEDKGTMMLTIALSQVILFILKSLIMVLKNQNDGFPIKTKRFTEKVNGDVRIRKGYLHEAILYLSEVEDYAERLGYTKKD